MKNGVFWDVTPCGSVRRLLVTASVVPSSPILVTLMKEGPGSSETSVLTRATRRNNPEDTILHLESRCLNRTRYHVLCFLWVRVDSDPSSRLLYNTSPLGF
jgi:hypothetical protein